MPGRMPSAPRWTVTVGLLAAGAAHLWSWAHGYRHTSVGPAFLGDAVASLVVAVRLIARGDRVGTWAAGVLAAAALVAYAMARTVGLFGFVERGWTPAALVAAGCEGVVLVLAVTDLLTPA
jgi:hypothetical protein